MCIPVVSWGAPNFITITTPPPFRVFQRSNCWADIPIRGVVAFGPVLIEARFNGQRWQVIGLASGGDFQGVLRHQMEGQGSIEVRTVDGATAEVWPVGIGDNFLIAGQSNATGDGINNQKYAHRFLKACLFGNDFVWHELVDPFDSASNQVDKVSAEKPIGHYPGGSAWPNMASWILTNQAVPVGICPASLGGSSITQWMASPDHWDRSTLYGSMVSRATNVGVKAVLWYQGEADAFGSSSEFYYSNLVKLASNVFADTGAKLMPCTLARSYKDGLRTQANLDLISDGVRRAWTNNPAVVLRGPDISDMACTPHSSHMQTDDLLQELGRRFWLSVSNAFY